MKLCENFQSFVERSITVWVFEKVGREKVEEKVVESKRLSLVGKRKTSYINPLTFNLDVTSSFQSRNT